MKTRLLQILVGRDQEAVVEGILEEHEAEPRWSAPLDGDRVMVEVILPAAGNEPLLDDLEESLRSGGDFRLLFLPLQATVPRMEPEEEESPEDEAGSGTGIRGSDEPVGSEKVPARVNREELYNEIHDKADANFFYVSMVALSAVVASAGLLLGDVAVIIGAMVIAPLIGPSMGLALATTLGDRQLGLSALKASVLGAAIAFSVSFLAGLGLEVDLQNPEIMGRTRLTYEHLALALAAGAAGALALAQGVGAAMVGVMVAVALLPPLANAGLLLGDGHMEEGMGALILVAGNVVCVNLAATAAFLLQGVRPNTWWEEGNRSRAVRLAAVLWGLLFVGLVVVVWLVWGGEAPSGPE
ncbi:MAG: TIGR00341 family protein [Gemmatimonadales bacterium]|nr:MAG: TIGR00341 family protein [Gemmatimonadales bacterium]